MCRNLWILDAEVGGTTPFMSPPTQNPKTLFVLSLAVLFENEIIHLPSHVALQSLRSACKPSKTDACLPIL